MLRYKEPNMVRPFVVPMGKFVGFLTLVFSFCLLYLYMPGNASALTPVEWAIFAGWMVLGVVLYIYSLSKNPNKSKEFMDAEVAAIKAHNQQWLKEQGMPSMAYENELRKKAKE